MAKRNDDDEVLNYIQNMYTYFNNPYEYISSGNKEVDSLMNYMLNKAESILGQVNYEINVPKELEIRSFDLNIMIGFVALAYYTGGKKALKYSLIEALWDDALA